MSVLVTGCAGFIGARICERLLGEGRPVIGVDLVDAPGDVEQRRRRLIALGERHGDRFQFRRVDVRDGDAVGATLASVGPVSAVIHLAARAGVRESVAFAADYSETNEGGTRNLLAACVRQGIPKLVLASSSSVYGNGPCPSRESQPLDPRSPYAASKVAAEVACQEANRSHGLDVSILRYFSVYGPGGRPDMCVPQFLERLCTGQAVRLNGDGSHARDFTFVEDIAAGTVAALRPLGCDVINLGAGRPVTIAALLHDLERLVGRRARVERHPADPADAGRNEADNSKARLLLGWSPRIRLEDGLRATVAWSLTQAAPSAA